MLPAGKDRISRCRARHSVTLSSLITFRLRSYHVTKFAERYANILLVASFFYFFLLQNNISYAFLCSTFMKISYVSLSRFIIYHYKFGSQKKKIFAWNQFLFSLSTVT